MTVATRRQAAAVQAEPAQQSAAQPVQPQPTTIAPAAPASYPALGQTTALSRTEWQLRVVTYSLITLVWFATLATGVWKYAGHTPPEAARQEGLNTGNVTELLHAGKGDRGVAHFDKDLPLMWFDRILRTVGPLLPLPVLALRAAVREANPHVRNKLPAWQEALAVYTGLAVTRLVVYLLHWAGFFAALTKAGAVSALPVHLMADHTFLSASLLATFSAEACLLISDMRHAARSKQPHSLLLAAGLVLCIGLALLICGDMFYTAKYFHPPTQVFWAAVSGLTMFQLPTLWWLLYGQGLFSDAKQHVQVKHTSPQLRQ